MKRKTYTNLGYLTRMMLLIKGLFYLSSERCVYRTNHRAIAIMFVRPFQVSVRVSVCPFVRLGRGLVLSL